MDERRSESEVTSWCHAHATWLTQFLISCTYAMLLSGIFSWLVISLVETGAIGPIEPAGETGQIVIALGLFLAALLTRALRTEQAVWVFRVAIGLPGALKSISFMTAIGIMIHVLFIHAYGFSITLSVILFIEIFVMTWWQMMSDDNGKPENLPWIR